MCSVLRRRMEGHECGLEGRGSVTTILYLILLLGGEPWRDGLDAVPVRFVAVAPYEGALGLACAPVFDPVAGNVQARCDERVGVTLYSSGLRDRETLLNVLRHEDYHLTTGPRYELVDPFDEAGAYRAGCDYSPVPACAGWIEMHQREWR